MNKDKITAMWEEDGDLMRIRKFFGYVYQDEDLKQRIKQKALAKISEPDEISESGEPGLKIEGERNPIEGLPKTKKSNKRTPLSLLKSINSKKGRPLLKVFSAAAVVVFAVYLGSILSNGTVPFTVGMGNSPKVASEQAQNDASYDTAGPAEGFMSSVSNESSANMEEKGFSLEDAPAPTEPPILDRGEITEAQEKDITERKIIYTLEATLRVESVDQAVDLIEEQVTSLGGYISESRKTDRDEEINAYMTIRIPVKHFESFKGDLSKYGTVSNQHLFSDDVSRQYFDVETRLRSWEAQEKRYLEILQQADTVEDILQIENSLANVRREMESLKGQLKYFDNRVDYSEVRMNIYPQQSNLSVSDPWQPVSIESTFLAAKNAVIKSISFIWNGANYIIVFVGYAIPVLVLLALGWLGFRRLRKSKSEG